MKCDKCGRELLYDWIYCPCQFGGFKDSELQKLVLGTENLVEQFQERYTQNPSPMMGIIVRATQKIFREMQEEE